MPKYDEIEKYGMRVVNALFPSPPRKTLEEEMQESKHLMLMAINAYLKEPTVKKTIEAASSQGKLPDPVPRF